MLETCFLKFIIKFSEGGSKKKKRKPIIIKFSNTTPCSRHVLKLSQEHRAHYQLNLISQGVAALLPRAGTQARTEGFCRKVRRFGAWEELRLGGALCPAGLFL